MYNHHYDSESFLFINDYFIYVLLNKYISMIHDSKTHCYMLKCFYSTTYLSPDPTP